MPFAQEQLRWLLGSRAVHDCQDRWLLFKLHVCVYVYCVLCHTQPQETCKLEKLISAGVRRENVPGTVKPRFNGGRSGAGKFFPHLHKQEHTTHTVSCQKKIAATFPDPTVTLPLPGRKIPSPFQPSLPSEEVAAERLFVLQWPFREREREREREIHPTFNRSVRLVTHLYCVRVRM